MATLYQISNNGSRAGRWDIEDAPVLVGRSGQAGVSVKDDGLSRRHFLISRQGNDFVIKDLNSRNGTWLAGRRVLAERLKDNDCILAGRTLFRFTDHPALSARLREPRMGPHGTVMMKAPRSDLL